jgi:hypothetical protein
VSLVRRNPLLIALGGLVVVAVGIAAGRPLPAVVGVVIIAVAAIRVVTGWGG